MHTVLFAWAVPDLPKLPNSEVENLSLNRLDLEVPIVQAVQSFDKLLMMSGRIFRSW
jgi:hypothetical protein